LHTLSLTSLSDEYDPTTVVRAFRTLSTAIAVDEIDVFFIADVRSSDKSNYDDDDDMKAQVEKINILIT
jgi:hypothetical protein